MRKEFYYLNLYILFEFQPNSTCIKKRLVTFSIFYFFEISKLGSDDPI